MTLAWHRALASALVGSDLGLPDAPAPQPDAVRAALADAGWDADRLAAHVAECRAAGEPWPHPVPDALRRGLGAAQFHAVLAALRHDLGLEGLEPRGPSRRTTLTPDERRLLADVPPHHGV